MIFGSEKVNIPNKMDDNLAKYDIGEQIKGTFNYEVDRKDAREIILCITKFSCQPQRRLKNEKEEY